MEVKEAADLLDNLIGMIEDSGGRDYDTALKMGIEALTSKPTDCISRRAAIDAAIEAINEWGGGWDAEREARDAINALPSAQPTEASCWGCNCPKMERLKEQKTFSEMVHLHDAEQQWIPVVKKPIEKGLMLVTYNDGDVDLLKQPTAYRRSDIVAWMPIEPWGGEEHDEMGG